MFKIIADIFIFGSFLVFNVPDWIIYFMLIFSLAWNYGNLGQKPPVI